MHVHKGRENVLYFPLIELAKPLPVAQTPSISTDVKTRQSHQFAKMTRTLYGHMQSPFVRSVAITLDVLGLDYEFKFVNLFEGEHKKPEYLKVVNAL